MYLDLNNDGAFAATELVGEALNTASPAFSLSLPAAAVAGRPLRLRIVADYVGSNPQPCKSPLNGQVEDYTVVPQANPNPPVAAFASTYVSGGCVNPVQFTDQSANAPTAWRWDLATAPPAPCRTPATSLPPPGPTPWPSRPPTPTARAAPRGRASSSTCPA